jgi:hypothetical protein
MCPVEDTGRNSVSPSTIAMMIVSRIVIYYAFGSVYESLLLYQSLTLFLGFKHYAEYDEYKSYEAYGRSHFDASYAEDFRIKGFLGTSVTTHQNETGNDYYHANGK